MLFALLCQQKPSGKKTNRKVKTIEEERKRKRRGNKQETKRRRHTNKLYL
jgi:hypothetical protein